MNFTYNGNTPKSIVYNNKNVKELKYNNVTVWKKAPTIFVPEHNWYWYNDNDTNYDGSDSTYIIPNYSSFKFYTGAIIKFPIQITAPCALQIDMDVEINGNGHGTVELAPRNPNTGLFIGNMNGTVMQANYEDMDTAQEFTIIPSGSTETIHVTKIFTITEEKFNQYYQTYKDLYFRIRTYSGTNSFWKIGCMSSATNPTPMQVKIS